MSNYGQSIKKAIIGFASVILISFFSYSYFYVSAPISFWTFNDSGPSTLFVIKQVVKPYNFFFDKAEEDQITGNRNNYNCFYYLQSFKHLQEAFLQIAPNRIHKLFILLAINKTFKFINIQNDKPTAQCYISESKSVSLFWSYTISFVTSSGSLLFLALLLLALRWNYRKA